jgi:hypothetical protein
MAESNKGRAQDVPIIDFDIRVQQHDDFQPSEFPENSEGWMLSGIWVEVLSFNATIITPPATVTRRKYGCHSG